MSAEQGSLGFNLTDQLFRAQRSRDEDEAKAKANGLLKSINYLMYIYGPVNFPPDHFRSATHIFDPGEYSLQEVPLETGFGDMWVHVSAKYGDVAFTDGLGEIVEGSLYFRMGDQTSIFTIPRTDFKDHYNADTVEYVEEKDEEVRVKARANLPPLDELFKVEHIFDLVWHAYINSGLVSNVYNPNFSRLLEGNQDSAL